MGRRQSKSRASSPLSFGEGSSRKAAASDGGASARVIAASAFGELAPQARVELPSSLTRSVELVTFHRPP
jgi:hypothetical protein